MAFRFQNWKLIFLRTLVLLKLLSSQNVAALEIKQMQWFSIYLFLFIHNVYWKVVYNIIELRNVLRIQIMNSVAQFLLRSNWAGKVKCFLLNRIHRFSTICFVFSIRLLLWRKWLIKMEKWCSECCCTLRKMNSVIGRPTVPQFYISQ